MASSFFFLLIRSRVPSGAIPVTLDISPQLSSMIFNDSASYTITPTGGNSIPRNLAALGCPKILIIGDTPLDIRCARAIGAKTLAVASGGADLAELEGHQPDWAVPDLQAITASEVVG